MISAATIAIEAMMAVEARKVQRTPRPTSRPLARTRLLKRVWTSIGSGFVTKVATSQLTVVTPTPMRSFFQETIGAQPQFGSTTSSTMAVVRADRMPTISLQALMRIQNQRSRKIGPDPAPMSSIRSKAVFALVKSGAIKQARTINTTVITRAGLGDYCCPPTGLAKMYNNIPGNKKIWWVQGSTHGYVPPEPNQHFWIDDTAK